MANEADVEELSATVSRKPKQIPIELTRGEGPLTIKLDTKNNDCEILIKIILEVPIENDDGELCFDIGRLALSANPIDVHLDLSAFEEINWHGDGLQWDLKTGLLVGSISDFEAIVIREHVKHAGDVSRFPAIVLDEANAETTAPETTFQNVLRVVDHVDEDGRVTPNVLPSVLNLDEELRKSVGESPVLHEVSEEQLVDIQDDKIIETVHTEEVSEEEAFAPPQVHEIETFHRHDRTDSMYNSDSLFTTICKEATHVEHSPPLRSSTPVEDDLMTEVTNSSTMAVRMSPVSSLQGDPSTSLETIASPYEGDSMAEDSLQSDMFEFSPSPANTTRRYDELTAANTMLNLARQRPRAGSLFKSLSNLERRESPSSFEASSMNSVPEYTSLAKIDFTPAMESEKSPILTSFFILTFTEKFYPAMGEVSMLVDIFAPLGTSLMMVRVNDENVSWDLVSVERVGKTIKQVVQIPHFGFNSGEAFCLITNTELVGFKNDIEVILPAVTIMSTKPSTEDVLLAKVRYPLYVKLNLDELEPWTHVQSYEDTERWKFERINLPGKLHDPLKIHLSVLQQIQRKESMRTYAALYHVTMTPHGSDVHLAIDMKIVRESKRLHLDPLIRLRHNHQLIKVEVDGFPTTVYSGIDKECVIMDTKRSSSQRTIDVFVSLIAQRNAMELPVLLDHSINVCRIVMGAETIEYTDVPAGHVVKYAKSPRSSKSGVKAVLTLTILTFIITFLQVRARDAALERVAGQVEDLFEFQENVIDTVSGVVKRPWNVTLYVRDVNLCDEDDRKMAIQVNDPVVEETDLDVEEVQEDDAAEIEAQEPDIQAITSLQQDFTTLRQRFSIDPNERLVFQRTFRWLLGYPY